MKMEKEEAQKTQQYEEDFLQKQLPTMNSQRVIPGKSNPLPNHHQTCPSTPSSHLVLIKASQAMIETETDLQQSTEIDSTSYSTKLNSCVKSSSASANKHRS